MDDWAHVAIGEPPVWFERRLFNVDEFWRMGPLTIIAECAELFGGCVTDHTGDGRPHCWTYEQYEAMAGAGILGEDERVELLEGEIVRMPPEGDRHADVVAGLAARLREWTNENTASRVQGLLLFNRVEALRPDLVLLRDREDGSRTQQPGPWDALLVVEVAGASIQVDRDVKGRRYARAAIPEYWIADVNREIVTVHLSPVGGEYTDVREYAQGESFVSPTMDGREVRVEDVLGPVAGESQGVLR